ncbi:uncharacterized protein LOC133801132 isoform X2 [Humulus lupulus]|uniref:uncharacterized protein LOC133801132 isoform X2 n=1 Tax=Humulus lupulus TaxID=3486 RepID=UPI002B416C0E|nr:uncharacterized protein LOC133801132 isoform X2 [Humulus lupulus]
MKHSLAIHNPNITVILIAAGVSHEPSSSPSSLPSPLPPFILYIHYYLFFSVVGPEDNPSEVHFADDGVESYLEEGQTEFLSKLLDETFWYIYGPTIDPECELNLFLSIE